MQLLLKLQIMCQLCLQTFKEKRTLRNHLRGMHGVGKMLACLNCGDGFKWSSGLALHRKKCPKLFGGNSELRTYEEHHTQEHGLEKK